MTPSGVPLERRNDSLLHRQIVFVDKALII
jgi:hypothetical protein